MNGKIKTKFAALFAVALMITVCVVPVVDNAGVDAAPVSSSNGEVFEGYDITLYKEGGDYSGLVYYGATAPAGVVGATAVTADPNYWVDADGKFITVDMVADYDPTLVDYGFPLIQVVYDYADAFNNIVGNIIIEQGLQKWTFPYNQSDNTKTQGVRQIQMGNGTYTDKLNLLPQNIAGDFKVTLSGTQGFSTETVSETVNAGVATTVSGIVKDAGQNPIADKNVTVSYKLNGSSSGSVTTDETGKYTIVVVPGTEVKITGVAYTGGAYTFTNAAYGFGTVNSSVERNYVANEYTGEITVQSLSGEAVKGATVVITWMYQKNGATDGTYAINSSASSIDSGIISGKVNGLSTTTVTTDENGKVKYSYLAPSGTLASTTVGYEYVLLASASTGSSNYTFDTVSVSSNAAADKTILSMINGKSGMGDAKNGSATLISKENTGTITVQSSNGNPIKGVTVTLQWYYQKDGSTQGTYIISSNQNEIDSGIVVGKVNNNTSATLTTDENGKVKYSYLAPSGTLASTTVGYANALVATATDLTSFSFEKVTVQGGQKSISTLIAENDGMADGKGAAAEITAEENSYKISGTIEGYKFTIPTGAILEYYVDNASTGTDVIVGKDGTFGFYVPEGSIINLKLTNSTASSTGPVPEFAADSYDPNAFALGTVQSDKVCDFKLKESSPVPASVEYQVDISMGSGAVKVNFEYTINGVKYNAVSADSSNATNATLTVSGHVGDEVTVSASIDSKYGKFVISEFDGYTATAVKMKDYYFRSVNSSTDLTVIPGATFDLKYTLYSEPVIEKITTGDDGFVSLTLPEGTSFQYAKDGRFVEAGAQWAGNYEFGTYSAVYLGDFYKPAADATVTIDYIAAYNVDDIYGVGGNDIAETYTYKTVVGGTVALKAPSIDGFEFVAWMVDGVVVSESADYTLKVDGSCHVDALYSAVHYEEPAEGLSMNVLVIGIVILILGILAVAYGIISKKQ